MVNMARYLQKYEGFTAPVDGHDASKEYDPSAHSTTGPVKITTYNYDWANYDKVISAAGQVPGWQLNQDPNTGNMLGLSTMQGGKIYLWLSISHGSRSFISQSRGASGRFARALNGRQQQTDKNSNDRNHHQQLDDGETAA